MKLRAIFYIVVGLMLGMQPSCYSKPILTLQSPKANLHLSIYSLSRSFLKSLVSLSNAVNFVETGTYMGDSTIIASQVFQRVYTIELAPVLYNYAKKRLEPYENIQVYQGDSKQVLPRLGRGLKGKTIFFLDGHHSGGLTAAGDSPIIGELLAIKNSNLDKPIILIDDIRDFVPPFNPSLASIEAIIKSMDGYKFYIYFDMGLAFHEDEPFTVSAVIEACTKSRMATECEDTKRPSDEEIYQAEMIIGQAQGQEKEALLELDTIFGGIYHYRIWAGLMKMHDGYYDEAKNIFGTVSSICRGKQLPTLGRHLAAAFRARNKHQ